MTASPGFQVELPLGFDAAATATRAALKSEGFEVLTEIDLRSTFRQQLAREFRRYTILGACNPALAYAALTTNPEIGLLLPCNVSLEETAGGGSRVRLADPRALLSASPEGTSPALQVLAAEAHERIKRVVRALREIEVVA